MADEIALKLIYNPLKNEEEKPNKKRIRIFGRKFVEKNKNNKNVKISIGINDIDEKTSLIEYLEHNEYYENNSIQVNLYGVGHILDFNHMCSECFSLEYITIIRIKKKEREKNYNKDNDYDDSLNFSFSSKLDFNESFIDEINSFPFYFKLSRMFYKCHSLKKINNDIFNILEIIAVEEMKELFYECKLLESPPDISKFNTENVQNLTRLFFNCQAIKSLPDISKWNTKKVSNISQMFCGCKSLEFLPDIS